LLISLLPSLPTFCFFFVVFGFYLGFVVREERGDQNKTNFGGEEKNAVSLGGWEGGGRGLWADVDISRTKPFSLSFCKGRQSWTGKGNSNWESGQHGWFGGKVNQKIRGRSICGAALRGTKKSLYILRKANFWKPRGGGKQFLRRDRFRKNRGA